LRASCAVLVVLTVACLSVATAGPTPLTLVQDGRPTASIVLDGKPTRAAQFAAAELQYHLAKMTGATVPIVTGAAPVSGVAILVGESAATRALGLASQDFAPQEYLIGFRPKALVLMGRDADDRGAFDYAKAATFPGDFDEQGSTYAVYDFLERCCGVRWYLPTELGEVIPKRPTLTVQGADVRRKPAMIYRYVYKGESLPADLIGDTVDHEGGLPSLDQRSARLYVRRMRQGGARYNANHSFYGFYKRFLKDHPDWFAQGYAGEPPQMCFSNPEFTKQVIADAREYFDTGKAQPQAVAAGDFFALVPMDNASWCRCERCRAQVLEQPTRGYPTTSNDTASDYIFGFINQVAREVGKTHPHKWLAALAYSRYVYPPTRERLEKNVSIMLCLQTRRTYSPESVRNDRRILQAWTRESVQRPKFVWLYYCYPSLWATSQGWRPYPGFFAHSLVGQIAQFHRSGVRGFFIEPSYLAHGQRSPLMDQLELYLAYRLADDPTLDGNREIAEFFTRYYGPAAAPMRALYEQMEATYTDPANHPGTGVAQSELQAWTSLGTEERMREYARLLSQARHLARGSDEVYARRVALFDRGIYRWMCEGRKSFLRLQELRGSQMPTASIPRIAAAQGAPDRADWTAAATLGNWSTLRGEATDRQVQARMAHDGTYLYVQLQEQGINPAKLVLGDSITVWNEDEWEVFFARERGPRFRQMGLNAAGVHFDLAYGESSSEWDSGVALHSDVSAPDRWTVRMALPLRQLVAGGAKPGDTLYFNAIRATRMVRWLAWSPTYGGFREPTRMGEIQLAK
jgi:hypothetical protein